MIRRGEEDFGFQGIGDVPMRGKLLSVVERDGVHEVADWLEATQSCCTTAPAAPAATSEQPPSGASRQHRNASHTVTD